MQTKKNETTQRKKPRWGGENRKKSVFILKKGDTNYVRGNQAFHVVQLPTLQPTAKRHSFM
jgi:hypothetical protein